MSCGRTGVTEKRDHDKGRQVGPCLFHEGEYFTQRQASDSEFRVQVGRCRRENTY